MKLRIPNIDRVGLVLDISRVLAGRGLNITSMEVKLDTTYMETEPLSSETGRSIIEDLGKIPQVLDKEDIPLLTQTFLKRYAARLQKPVTTISETALRKLMTYHWPGNIRELENVIERAVNIITGPVVLAEHIILDHDLSPQPDAFPSSGVRSLDEVVSEAERAALAQALEKYPSARKLGSAMGLSHTAVLKKLKKYALSLPKNR